MPTFLDLIERHATTSPDAHAAIYKNTEITYLKLLTKASALAIELSEKYGVKPGDIVGLCLESSFELLISMLAIQKAGAAYVPIDPDFPVARKRYIQEQVGLSLVLMQRKFRIDLSPLSDIGVSLVPINIDNIGEADPTYKQPRNQDTNAYIIFTSGSTGKPKGVVVPTRGLTNLVVANREIFLLKPNERFLQFASISFDASVYEVYSALASGATLVLASRDELMPGKPLADLLRAQQVGLVCLPPSVLSTLNDFSTPSLKTVIVAGEACPPALAKHWSSQGVRFFNAYGPTEITVCATIYEYQPNSSPNRVPIGKPLPNIHTYVLGDDLNPVEIGEPGELFVGGISVTSGYFGQPELTQKAYLPNPYAPGMMYRTGDIVTQDPETGDLIFVGRQDQQIKIRGFRVELGAIENAILEAPGVSNTVVRVYEQQLTEKNAVKFLVAYIEPKPGVAVDVQRVKRHVADQLPEYMVPHTYMVLESLPLAANRGKVDVNALPIPTSLKPDNANADEMSLRVARLVDLTLGLPPETTGTAADFFQLGGDSLSMATLIHHISEEYDILLPPKLVYENPTPESIAMQIRNHKEHGGDRAIAEPYVDLGKEAELPADLCPDPAFPMPGKPRKLLYTGATGFMGAHVLEALLKRGDLECVYALVRADSKEHAQARLQKVFEEYGLDQRVLASVVGIPADIQHPMLGLSHEQYQHLSQETDSVLHCAADISYIRPYSAMKKPNVDGTKHLLKFAVTNGTKSFHHVSSMSVYGATWVLLDYETVWEDFDIDISKDIVQVENGYTKGKWVAERMVQEMGKRGLPISIYRPGFIQGHSESGVANINDLFCRLVMGCIQMGFYPDFPKKYWMPVPVDFVAQSTAQIFHSQPAGKAYNLIVDRRDEFSHEEIFEAIAKMGYPLEKVNFKNWLAMLKKLGPDNQLFPLVSFLSEKIYDNRATILEVHYRTPDSRFENLKAAIAGSGIQMPEAREDLLHTYISYFAQLGLIPAKALQLPLAQSS